VRRNPLIAAVDTSDLDRAAELGAVLAGEVSFLKVGLQLFTAAGPPAVGLLRDHAPVFLDLKLHDIPTTVGLAAANAGRLGPELLTVHALGGPAMIRAAVEGAERGARDAGFEPPTILGVTVLSSLGGEGLASPASLAFEAVDAGAGGVVVSGPDVKAVREVVGPDVIVVVPGIRPAGHAGNDQVRVLTPGEALELGGDYIVIGRPITGSDDPAAAARAVLREVGAA
jgi:orotidine-5'-phosphate decarboxylase